MNERWKKWKAWLMEGEKKSRRGVYLQIRVECEEERENRKG